VKIPGLSNIWIPPIRNRIDMLATGIKSPIGVKVTGNDLGVIDRIAAEVEQVAKGIPGVTSSLAERLTGGRYVDVQIDRVAAGRYGLNIADVQAVIAGAVGGENVSETVEGRSICATRENGVIHHNGWQNYPSSRRWVSRSRWGPWHASRSPMGRPCSRARTHGPPVGSMSMCAAVI